MDTNRGGQVIPKEEHKAAPKEIDPHKKTKEDDDNNDLEGMPSDICEMDPTTTGCE